MAGVIYQPDGDVLQREKDAACLLINVTPDTLGPTNVTCCQSGVFGTYRKWRAPANVMPAGRVLGCIGTDTQGDAEMGGYRRDAVAVQQHGVAGAVPLLNIPVCGDVVERVQLRIGTNHPIITRTRRDNPQINKAFSFVSPLPGETCYLIEYYICICEEMIQRLINSIVSRNPQTINTQHILTYTQDNRHAFFNPLFELFSYFYNNNLVSGPNANVDMDFKITFVNLFAVLTLGDYGFRNLAGEQEIINYNNVQAYIAYLNQNQQVFGQFVGDLNNMWHRFTPEGKLNSLVTLRGTSLNNYNANHQGVNINVNSFNLGFSSKKKKSKQKNINKKSKKRN